MKKLTCLLMVLMMVSGAMALSETMAGDSTGRLLSAMTTQEKAEQELDYAIEQNWVSIPEARAYDVDTFFILPTVNMKETVPGNEDITDERKASRFVKTFGMEKGIVSECTDVYAPYYRQVTIAAYLDENGMFTGEKNAAFETYESVAYRDIRNAWLYYLEHWNNGRPVVLFGYSQGAEMALKLLAEFGEEGVLADQLVAAYAIGWPVEEAFLAEHPYLKMAQGETDTGVIISYNAVDERAETKGPRVCAINPLNWKTDGTPAAKEENLGFAVVNTYGEITQEIPACCGAYLEADSGKLIVTDAVNRDELYAATGTLFPAGDYHMYDLNLFYRNLQKNVADRISAFRAKDPSGTEMGKFRDIQYVLYLGTNDKDTNKPVFTQTEALEKVKEILLRHFGGYTIQEAHGGWIDEGTEYQEYTLVIYLSDTTLSQVHAAADEMIEAFHQSSVLIQENPTRTEFYSSVK